jgi:hypothetical protein
MRLKILTNKGFYSILYDCNVCGYAHLTHNRAKKSLDFKGFLSSSFFSWGKYGAKKIN